MPRKAATPNLTVTVGELRKELRSLRSNVLDLSPLLNPGGGPLPAEQAEALEDLVAAIQSHIDVLTGATHPPPAPSKRKLPPAKKAPPAKKTPSKP